MPSTFAWLDTNESDRRRALDVIDLFSLRDTRDQLGIATIRDAWSDRLAPGTSTVQTRARYFFFVPWIYLELERKGVSAADVGRRARRAELALIEAIQEADPEGVPIGARAGRGLKRLPSDIYWGGLDVLRIRLFEGARASYHRTFGRAPAYAPGEEEAPLSGNWNPHLPPAPAGFPKGLSLRLSPEEAEFLRDQILRHASGSLLAHLVGQERTWEDAEFPWEHPAVHGAPEALRKDIEHARSFSLGMHGAALLYNLMLAERREWAERVEEYRAKLEGWAAQAGNGALRRWDRRAFWSATHALNPRIHPASRHFADQWLDRVLAAGDPMGLAGDGGARELIRERERRLKGPRARLFHREHLEQWSGGSGARALDYRWPITQRIVRDVMEGLGS